MKKQLFLKEKFPYLFFILFLISGITWGQGFEDFTNFSTSGNAYVSGDFTGNNGLVWTYVGATSNASPINAPNPPAMTFKDKAGKVTSGTISNGIGNFKVKVYKAFTGAGLRQIEVFINGISYGVSIPFDDTDEHVLEVEGINVGGAVSIEIRNIRDKQVSIDDIEWTSFDPSGNTPPVITNVQTNPVPGSITPADPVELSAQITDPDGIASVSLSWGTTSGNLNNTIPMTVSSGNTYVSQTKIPAQPHGTTVYFKIEATDAHAEPLTASTPEYDYYVQAPGSFNLPYSNGFRTAGDLAAAQDQGFIFNNVNNETGGGGYLRIQADGSFITPSMDFTELDRIFIEFDIATYGSNGGQGILVSVSENDGLTYELLGTFIAESSTYMTFSQFVDVTNLNTTNGRIKFEKVGGTNAQHVRFRDFTIREFVGYSYNLGWTPSDPSGVSTASDDIFVFNGNADINGVTTAKNFYVGATGLARINDVLDVRGEIQIDGRMLFVSTATGDGQLAPIGSKKVRGDVTVERYISSNRAYRMVTSSVSSELSIHDNWQEFAESNTHNPNPGYGTHITGSKNDQENGFDGTETGNPSMFIVDVEEQKFVPIDNTNVNKLTAGEPYLLFVRGDRGIDLGSNNSKSETVLRASGELKTGNVTQSFDGMQTGEFAMFGNPYQSVVDVKKVLSASSKVNKDFYFVFDPTLNNHGAYVTVDLTDGNGTNTAGSPANKYLQPGQAAQFAASTAGMAEVKFKEADKAPGNFTATNFGETNLTASDIITAQLYTAERYAEGGTIHDSFGILFAPHYSNEVTLADAPKPINFDENLGIDSNGHLLSIERRQMPEEGEVFKLFSTGYTQKEYVLKLDVKGLENSSFSLYDAYTGISTPLTATTAYPFEVDSTVPESIAEDRFFIIVERVLGTENHVFAGIQLYPNPIAGDSFAIQAPSLNGQQIDVAISDMTGRIIYEGEHLFEGNITTVKVGEAMTSGIYLVKVTVKGEIHTFRVIKR